MKKKQIIYLVISVFSSSVTHSKFSFFSNGYLSAEEVELSKSELSKTFPDGIPASGADALRWALLRLESSFTFWGIGHVYSSSN